MNTTKYADLPVATPTQIVEAWEAGVMNGVRSQAAREIADHPIPKGCIDPTFYRDEEGWRRASEISNPSAAARLESYLLGLGARVPDSTRKAWEQTWRERDVERNVEGVVATALQDLRGGDSTEAAAVRTVIDALTTHLTTLED